MTDLRTAFVSCMLQGRLWRQQQESVAQAARSGLFTKTPHFVSRTYELAASHTQLCQPSAAERQNRVEVCSGTNVGSLREKPLQLQHDKDTFNSQLRSVAATAPCKIDMCPA